MSGEEGGAMRHGQWPGPDERVGGRWASGRGQGVQGRGSSLIGRAGGAPQLHGHAALASTRGHWRG